MSVIKSATPAPTSIAPELAALQAAELEDHRRYARRPCKLAAKLHIQETWSAELENVREFAVIVRNISRNGVCFMFFRQLYPDDRISLDFGDLLRHYRVARCHRVADNCYEVGAAIISSP